MNVMFGVRLRSALLLIAGSILVSLCFATAEASAATSTTPSVSLVTPSRGPVAGGTRVTISGQRFVHVTAVLFGSTRGSAVLVKSSTSLQVTAPAHVAGWVWVRVVTTSGTSALVAPAHFSFVAVPRVTSVAPASGWSSGGTRVVVRGTTFVDVTGVTFAGHAGHAISVSYSGELSVVAPAGAVGVADIRVATRYGTSPLTTADRFTYVSPKRVQSYQYAGTTDPNQSLTATWLRTRTKAPWVVTIHGGSWINGSQLNTASAANLFYTHGWQAFNLSYSVGTTVPYSQQVADLRAARTWIVAHAAYFGIDPNRGTAYGFSAGGHLAAVLGISGGFRTVVSLSGVLQPQRVAEDALQMDPNAAPATSAEDSLYKRERTMMGCTFTSVSGDDDCSRRWRDFCPEFAITSTRPMPAFYIVQGDVDPVVPLASAYGFAKALSAQHVPNEVVKMVGFGHTDQDVLGSSTQISAMLRWVVNHSS